MHLIERYALSTGSKIEKPYVNEVYFPIPFEKYITFQAQSKFQSKDYDYFQDVIDFLVPILEKYNIHIVQLGTSSEKPYKRVVDLRGQTSLNQLAYVMKNSMLHFGPDSLGIHLASVYDVPIVGLYSITQTTVAGPYFGNKEKQILIDAYKNNPNGKPSYSPQENPKCINSIKPEDIAHSIFKLLNIDFNTQIKTIYTGSKYTRDYVRELIPNNTNIINNSADQIEIRMDLHFDENILAHHLSYLKKAIVITDKPISLKLLSYFKSNIAIVGYRITENDNPDFFAQMIKLGLPCVLLSSLEGDILTNKKLNYYEYAHINPMIFPKKEKVEEIRKDLEGLYFKSCKLIASGDKIYGSHASVDKNVILTKDSEYQSVIDTPSFWEDLEFFTIIKVIK